MLRILRNRLYVGEISCQGEFVVAVHSGLIDTATFDRVQAMLQPKARRVRGECRNPIYLVRGTLRCGLCGSTMTSASSFREGRLHRYYRCGTRDKKGKKVCPTIQLPAEAIEAFVVERVVAAMEDPAHRTALEIHLGGLGLRMPKEGFIHLWDALTLPNRRRLIGLLVEEAKVDQFKGSLSLRFRDLRAMPLEEGASC